MEKDSYWFRHDSTAGRGIRMRKMAHIHGHWGKGVYWDVIEILRDQSNYQFESDDSSLQMLCDLIGCKDEKKFISWFRDCIRIGLFHTHEKNFFSEVLCKNMRKWEATKHAGTQSGKSRKRTNHELTLNESGTNSEHKIREDKIREKEVFNSFRSVYPGTKLGNQTEFDNFCAKHDDWKVILPTLATTLQQQIKTRQAKTSKGEFVPEWKNLKTWINQRCWEEEMPATPTAKSEGMAGRTFSIGETDALFTK